MSATCASIGCPNMGTVLHTTHARTQGEKKPDGMRYLPSWRCETCSENLKRFELYEIGDEEELYLDTTGY